MKNLRQRIILSKKSNEMISGKYSELGMKSNYQIEISSNGSCHYFQEIIHVITKWRSGGFPKL